MLAFNLGVFFRNLHGEEVTFTAKSPQCEVNFTGGVVKLQERTDLTPELSVTLNKGNLYFQATFEENEEEEERPEDAVVQVILKLELPEEKEEVLLLETQFRFGEISLKPAGEGEEEKELGPSDPDDPQLA
jgi:hypothetical protein